jgi:hypothetical protein
VQARARRGRQSAPHRCRPYCRRRRDAGQVEDGAFRRCGAGRARGQQYGRYFNHPVGNRWAERQAERPTRRNARRSSRMAATGVACQARRMRVSARGAATTCRTMSELLISADSHVLEPADLWTKGLPAALRSRAPRVFFSDDRGIWLFGCEEVAPQPMRSASSPASTSTIFPRCTGRDTRRHAPAAGTRGRAAGT